MKKTLVLFMALASIGLALALTGCCPQKGAKGDKGEDGLVTILPGVPGQDGHDGANGANGSDGAQGPAGADGTIVTVVQLCPGVTAYPGVFVEVAMIINGKMYAVYSANNGFLTELPPGNYSSNAVGSACNFTVNADLTVSH